MCGIVGCTLPEECPPERFDRMIDVLERRGPDARGAWRDGRVALGHRRLSVLDPSPAGAQPMAADSGRVRIVYNGEFYNHLEIRKSFPARTWRSTSDTETLLALYEREGPDFVRHVNGMFAMALYDEPKGRLYLYRDRLGIKPLYYAFDGTRLLFASTLRPLALHPRFSRDLDTDAVRDYFLFNYIPAPRTIFRAARKLEPGHLIEYDVERRTFAMRAWWRAADHVQPDAPPPPNRRKALDERADELEALLLDAVRLRTISDVPLGCFLSGGIDSSAVTWALTQAGAGAVKSFNIGFEQAAYDESFYAQRVARHLGTEHRWRHFTRRECQELIPRLGIACDEPFADASLLPTMLLSEMTRRHVTVSLSGDGGDELFLGYDRYRWAETIAARLGGVPDGLRRASASALARLPSYRLRMMAQSLTYERRGQIYPWIFIGWNAPFVERLLGRPVDFGRQAIHGLRGEIPAVPLAREASYTDLRHYLMDDILTKVDRASMHVSLEARVPLLDYRIVEFALRQPAWANRGADGEGKLLLRRVLHRHVPPRLFRRPKAGFAVPLFRWFRGPLRPMLEEKLGTDALARHGLFDAACVRDILARHHSGRWNFERQIWALLVFQLWHEEMMA